MPVAPQVVEMLANNGYQLHKACFVGDVQSVSMILSSFPHSVYVEDSFQNWTPAHWAAYGGSLSCLTQIVSVEPLCINIRKGKTSETPLHCSAAGGHPQCVNWLLQMGANPDLKDNLGETPLHKAARVGSAECISIFLSIPCNTRVCNLNGESASTLARLNGFLHLADFISRRESSHIAPPDLSQPSRGRKRGSEVLCENGLEKRLCTGDGGNEDVDMNALTTSAVEHNSLCTMERGYRNSLIDSWLCYYHG